MSRFVILESSLPDGSERVLWFRSKIMSSISPISKTFFRLQRSDERNRKGFLLPLLMLVLLLLNEVDPDVGMDSVGWREGRRRTRIANFIQNSGERFSARQEGELSRGLISSRDDSTKIATCVDIH